MAEQQFRVIKGRTVPIGGPRKTGGGTVLAAIALAGALAAGGGAAAGGALGGGALGAGGSGGVAQSTGLSPAQLKRAVGNSRKAARRGQHDEAWRRLGFRPARRAIERHAECVVHSYGQVQQFFVRNPCRELQRMLYAVIDGDGNTIVVSVAWVRMAGARSARELRKLADVYGTGNVSPIAGAALELGGVPFTGQHYQSRRSRSLVVIAEAEPASGRPDPALLDAAADVAVLFPPP